MTLVRFKFDLLTRRGHYFRSPFFNIIIINFNWFHDHIFRIFCIRTRIISTSTWWRRFETYFFRIVKKKITSTMSKWTHNTINSSILFLDDVTNSSKNIWTIFGLFAERIVERPLCVCVIIAKFTLGLKQWSLYKFVSRSMCLFYFFFFWICYMFVQFTTRLSFIVSADEINS